MADTIYSKLCAAARPVLRSYTRDLTYHDRRACRCFRPGDAAIYAVRSDGTHLMLFRSATDTTVDQAIHTAARCVEFVESVSFVAPDAQWYLIDCTSPQRGNVTPISSSEAYHTPKRTRDRLIGAPKLVEVAA